MNPPKELLLQLIADDLVNYRLVKSLQVLGVDATAYCLHLSDSIFYLTALNDENEEMRRELYYQLSKNVLLLDVNDQLAIKNLCAEIFEQVFAA